jgi:hypothetical protein
MSDPSAQSAMFTRRELVSLVRALEEYEAECIPPRRDLSERVNAVLRGPGERFAIVPVEEDR